MTLGGEIKGLNVLLFVIKVKFYQQKWYLEVKIGKKWHLLRKLPKLIDKFVIIWDESPQKWYLQVNIAEQYENLASPLKPPKIKPLLTILLYPRRVYGVAPVLYHTLVRVIMTGNIVAGKNNGGYKCGGIAEKPPNLTRHRILPAILQNSTQFSFQTAHLFAVSK